MERFILIYQCERCLHQVSIEFKEPEDQQQADRVFERMKRIEAQMLKRVCDNCGKLGVKFKDVQQKTNR